MDYKYSPNGGTLFWITNDDDELSGTCQDLLYRRARALADYENSNKALDKARLKSKDIPQAEEHQKHCLQKFDKLSESGKKGPYIHLSCTYP